MKIVIEIPDKIYNTFHRGNWSATYEGKKIRDIVMNGTPLPEHHGRLIDADALQTEMDKDVRRAMSFVDLKDFVWLAPTIIEAECTYKETGCGSCKKQLNCPIEAEGRDAE